MMAQSKKPYIVRGKITFALGVEAKDARSASDSVQEILDSLGGRVRHISTLTVHEWEVLTEQIERSE